jgi:hypothetical protein
MPHSAEVGQAADLAVIDHNLFALPVDESRLGEPRRGADLGVGERSCAMKRDADVTTHGAVESHERRSFLGR